MGCNHSVDRFFHEKLFPFLLMMLLLMIQYEKGQYYMLEYFLDSKYFSIQRSNHEIQFWDIVIIKTMYVKKIKTSTPFG